MRIALFTETYLPHINGVVTHVKLLREGLEKLGHEVLVVTADGTARHHYIKDGVLYCPGASIKRFYNYGVAPPFSRTRLKLLQQFAPDIIHIHNEFGIGLSGVLASKLLRKPLVYTLHTMYEEYLYYVSPSAFLGATKQIYRTYTRFLSRNAAALTGPSKKCEDYFRDIGVMKFVNVIPNAVELDAFMPENITEEQKTSFRKQYNLPEHIMLACFVGRLGREKSVDVLLDYWAKAIKPEDEIHLVIIGDGPCREELMQQAKALGIENMTTFTGAVLHEKLPPYLASCDIYITASLSDTNSISMLEGMATGLPVLQRNDPVNADQVRNGINGYVFDSPAELGEELRKVKTMPADQLAALKQSVTTSVAHSGAVDLANYMLAVYQNICEKEL